MSYETLFSRVLFPAYERAIRRNTHVHLAQYEQTQWLDRAGLARLQLERLNQLLQHCWEHVPFLAERWRQCGLSAAPLKQVADLARYPITEKADIQANYERAISSAWRGRTLVKTTGGSTGDPFRFEYTMASYARRTAVMWRGYAWAGAGPGSRTAYVWGTGLRSTGWGAIKDRLYHAAFNRKFLDAFSMSDANVDEYLDQINRFRPKAIVGYVAPVEQLARRLQARGSGLGLSSLRGVLTGAEALYPPQRELIQQSFGVPVFNTYGSREFMLIASECERHEGLHVNADHLVVETVDRETPTAAGESGDVIVTDLSNFGMPLVRYRNGDRATRSDATCSCGRGLPLLASVDGRILDLIVTPDGRRVPGEYFVYVMLSFTELQRYQAVQIAPDTLEFRYVATNEPDAALLARLHARLVDRLGNAIEVRLRRVPNIDLTRSGKRRISVAFENSAQYALPPEDA